MFQLWCRVLEKTLDLHCLCVHKATGSSACKLMIRKGYKETIHLQTVYCKSTAFFLSLFII